MRDLQVSYQRLKANGIIVERGLHQDAKIFDELVFDVNTDFFEQGGGYEFATRFYQEAYRLTIEASEVNSISFRQ